MDIKEINFYDGIDMRMLRLYFPETNTFGELMQALKVKLWPDDYKIIEPIIVKKSKYSFDINFERGLCIWGKFNFNIRTKIVKRLL